MSHSGGLALTCRQEPWFLEINPNGRIPALTDIHTDGKPIRFFESGSIMQYLVDRYDPDHKVSYPQGSREYYETNNWVWRAVDRQWRMDADLAAAVLADGRPWADAGVGPSDFATR